jgi:hypothetical protein
MTAYTIQSPAHAGLQLAGTLPTTGAVDTCPTGANIAMVITGPSSASATVAIPLPAYDGQAVTARSVTVASGQTWIVPMPATVYGPGPVTLTWSGTLTASAVNVVAVSG